MSDPSKNLILNLLGGLLSLATTQPDVGDLHRRIDDLAGVQNQTNSNNDPIVSSSSRSGVLSNNHVSGNQNEQEHTETATTGIANNPLDRSTTRLDVLCNAANSMNVSKTPVEENSTNGESIAENKVNRATDVADPVFVPALPPPPVDDVVDASLSATIDDDAMDFPNGDVTYVCHDIRQRTSWATDTYKTYKSKDNRKKIFKKCLGVYVCNEFDCGFVTRPKFTRRTGTTPTTISCSFHPDAELSYLPCPVRLVITLFPDKECIEIKNSGRHPHPRPPKIKPSPKNYDKFELMVNTANEATPLTLSVGTETRPPVGTIDSAFKNLDRVRHYTHKIRNTKRSSSDLGEIIAINEANEYPVLKSINADAGKGHIIFQTKGMEEIMHRKENAMQTDTTMGYLKDECLPSVNLTFTSTYSSILDCYVPILFGILFGMTADHYCEYFRTLLKLFKFENFEEFDTSWPGMVCDFSEAEQAGFESALRGHFNIESSTKLDMARYYTCCEVHFISSRARVARNHSVIPSQRKSEFDKLVTSLCQEGINLDSFNKQVKALKKGFPRATKWINWYLHERRRHFIFPVFGKVAFTNDGNNTNGQESQNNLVQLTTPENNPSILHTFQHLLRFANNRVDVELSSIKTGLVTRYKGSRKRKQVNDGRPPDRTSQLSPPSRKRLPGRPHYSRNLAPTKDSVQDLSFGIPWSYEYMGVSVTNTCAMDTVLMSLYFVRKYEMIPLTLLENESTLTCVLNLLADRKYSEARHLWISLYDRNGAGKNKNRMYNNIADKKDENNWNCWTGIPSIVAKISMFSFRLFIEYTACSENVNCPHHDYFDGEYAPVWKENHTGMRLFHLDSHSDISNIYETVICRDFHPSNANLQRECGEEYRMSPSCPCAHRGDDSDEEVLASHKASFCKGKRNIRRVLFKDPPCILHLTVSYLNRNADIGFDPSSSTVGTIQQHFKWAGKTYVLATIILNNGSHYCSISLVGGKYILYDGMYAGNKLRWWNANHVIGKQLNAYRITDLWYTATCEPESESNDSDYESSSSSSTELSLEKKPRAKKKCKSSKKPANIEGTKESKPKHPRRTYPMGLSIFPVSNKGQLPMCEYCRSTIKRFEPHAILKKQTNNPSDKAKTWMKNFHYHLKCYRGLDQSLWDQLLAILEGYQCEPDDSAFGEEWKHECVDKIRKDMS